MSGQDYYVLFITFESMSAVDFQAESNFIREFSRQIARTFRRTGQPQWVDFVESHKEIETFGQLDDFISQIGQLIGKPMVLLIDEVDKSSDNQLFLNFLALLRSKYLARHKYITFHSVVLSGVYDVKNLKLRFRPDEEKKYNSPWNIATDFDVDLAFNPVEIATMLEDYILHTGIALDIPAVSEKLYYYTHGHPFLISKMCKIIDEEILPNREKNKSWLVHDVHSAFERLVRESYTTTNFDDITKNLENNKQLYDLVFRLIIDGERKSFNIGNPVINLGSMLGLFTESEEGLAIHNRVYEQRIYNYMSSKIETTTDMEGYNFRNNFLAKNNSLDFEKVLLKFQEFMKMQYSRKNKDFLEKDGRLVFLAFIKPIINRKGFDFKEVQISEEKRLDVVVTYLNHKYTVELKIWYSEEYHKRGIRQLTRYLEDQSLDKGYLVIFDFRSRKKEWKHERIQVGDKEKEIFAIWV